MVEVDALMHQLSVRQPMLFVWMEPVHVPVHILLEDKNV